MSATHTSSSTNSVHCAPWGNTSRSRTSASHAGTSASRPAAAAAHGRHALRRERDPHKCAEPPEHRDARSRSRPCAVAEIARRAPSSAATRSTYAARSAGARPLQERNADHSQAPASTSAVSTTTVAHGGSHEHRKQHHRQHDRGDDSLCAGSRSRTPRHAGELRGGLAEAPLAVAEKRQARPRGRQRKVRPERVGEIQLRVGEVP